MSDTRLSKLESAWRAVLWTTLQRNFPFTPFVRVPTQDRPSGLLLLVVTTFVALLAMTFQAHVAGLQVLPGPRSGGPAAESVVEFGSFTLEAALGAMQLSRLTPWAVTMLIATSTALVMQLGLIGLVMLIGRVKGVRSMTIGGLSYWVIQPVAWTAVSACIAAAALVGLRGLLGGGLHPLPEQAVLALSAGSCLLGLMAPLVLLGCRLRQHGKRLASAWESVAVTLLLSTPVSLLTTSAWKLATERAQDRVPTILVRGLQACDQRERTCTLALTSSNAPEFELVADVAVQLQVADDQARWMPHAFRLRATLLNEGEPPGMPIVLEEGKRRYVRLQFDANQDCPSALRKALTGDAAVAIRTTFQLAGLEFSSSGEARYARVKSDNPNYLPGLWHPTIGQACAAT